VLHRYSTRISPSIGNRVVDTAKEILVGFTPNVYIYTDNYSKKEAGLYLLSPPPPPAHTTDWWWWG
jgi:hypothetical protein